MQQGGDYSASYYPHNYPFANPNPNPNPNPNEFMASNPIHHPAFSSASAPPYSPYAGADFPAYPSYPQTSDPVPTLPPSAPSYSNPPQSQFPSYQPYNPPPPFPSESQPSALNYYSPDQPHHPPTGVPSYNPNPIPNPNPNAYPHQSTHPQHESSPYGMGGDYFNQGSGNLGANAPVAYDNGLGEGVYRYDGGSTEPYGARGTGSTAWSGIGEYGRSGFDDFGRSTSFSSPGEDQSGSTGKIVRAVPKMERSDDVKGGVQKFRVKLLPEGGSNSTVDVLCQIGLDGIRMLDPSTSRTLRIYPLETVTRWEVTDPSIYTFWAKSSVDIESRRIRLQSNSYTTSTILDTVTAATVQLKEMGGRDNLGKGTVDTSKLSDVPTEKKKGLVDWMNLIKPANEEKEHWVPDEAVTKCTSCRTDFGAFIRKHHCRNCGDIFCDKCTQGRIGLTADENAQPVRVCDRCLAEVSQRLSNAKETTNKSAALQSHEDLARKLQMEMDKKKSSTGSRSSDVSGGRMREVACTICTVHLQVKVPTSGSETIECGVCQHPFLVSAH